MYSNYIHMYFVFDFLREMQSKYIHMTDSGQHMGAQHS